jgi:hypothetical protein
MQKCPVLQAAYRLAFVLLTKMGSAEKKEKVFLSF